MTLWNLLPIENLLSAEGIHHPQHTNMNFLPKKGVTNGNP